MAPIQFEPFRFLAKTGRVGCRRGWPASGEAPPESITDKVPTGASPANRKLVPPTRMNTLRIQARLRLRVNDLPVLPHAIVKLMSLRQDDPEYFEQLLAVIELEPNFAARVLIMANSAKMGSHAPVTSLRDSMTRIGSAGVANLVLAMAVTRVFVPRDDWERSLWVHAFHVATAARQLAEILNRPDVSPDTAYLCGLLHDVGRFVMLQEDAETLRRVDEGDWDDPESLVALEKSICGINHADLGALICEGWKLPEVVVESVRRHHQAPFSQGDTPVDHVCNLVRVADILMFPTTQPGDGVASTELATALAEGRIPEALQPTEEQWETILEETNRRSAKMAETLGF